jgi:hypothetical protein
MDASVIDAGGLDRGIEVIGTYNGNPYPWDMVVTICDLTVRGGGESSAAPSRRGGGGIRSDIFDVATLLTLDRVALRDNVTTGSGGGLACH